MYSIDYQYVGVTVAEKSFLDHLDLELQAVVGAGLLPGVGVVPAERLPVTDAQVGESFGPH